MTTRTVNTTVGQNSWRAVVSAAVAFAIAFVSAHFGHLDKGEFAVIWGLVTPSYFATISYLEAKFPKLAWLFLLFPQQPAVGSKVSKK
jgi:hypothetical protein